MVMAEVLGYNPQTQRHEVLIRCDRSKNDTVVPNRQDAIIRSYKNSDDADLFAQMVNSRQTESDRFTPQGVAVSELSGFAPKRGEDADKRPQILKILFPTVGCDMPEQGGLSGNMNKKDLDYPFVCYLA